MNRILLERMRSMLLNDGLPKSFWGEAVAAAYYLINRSSSTALDLKTPMEYLNGVPADYSHLRVFGWLAVHMLNRINWNRGLLNASSLVTPLESKGIKSGI